MKKLKFEDFELAITMDRHLYKSFEFNGYEICLEECLNGFDVAIYKLGPDERIADLVEPKKCTDFDFKKGNINKRLTKGQQNMIRLRAMKFANQFYKKYNS